MGLIEFVDLGIVERQRWYWHMARHRVAAEDLDGGIHRGERDARWWEPHGEEFDLVRAGTPQESVEWFSGHGWDGLAGFHEGVDHAHVLQGAVRPDGLQVRVRG